MRLTSGRRKAGRLSSGDRGQRVCGWAYVEAVFGGTPSVCRKFDEAVTPVTFTVPQDSNLIGIMQQHPDVENAARVTAEACTGSVLLCSLQFRSSTYAAQHAGPLCGGQL